MSWISVDDRLPHDRQTVLVWAGNLKTVILDHEQSRVLLFLAVFRQGKTATELPRGPWSFYDEWSNNQRPYAWDASPMKLYGQDVTHWMETPPAP